MAWYSPSRSPIRVIAVPAAPAKSVRTRPTKASTACGSTAGVSSGALRRSGELEVIVMPETLETAGLPDIGRTLHPRGWSEASIRALSRQAGFDGEPGRRGPVADFEL